MQVSQGLERHVEGHAGSSCGTRGPKRGGQEMGLSVTCDARLGVFFLLHCCIYYGLAFG